jgi:hypothetical protein
MLTGFLTAVGREERVSGGGSANAGLAGAAPLDPTTFIQDRAFASFLFILRIRLRPIRPLMA